MTCNDELTKTFLQVVLLENFVQGFQLKVKLLVEPSGVIPFIPVNLNEDKELSLNVLINEQNTR